MKRLVIGCGYLGQRVAHHWVTAGDTVFALTRNPVRAETFDRDGILPFVADIHDISSLAGLPEVDTVLYAVGFDRTGSQTIRDVFVEGLRNVLSQLPVPRGRFIYISSTGTYGQDDGGWVDEESPCDPVREGGKACLDAENLLLQENPGMDSCRLRLAGIYGPGRIPRREDLQAGKVIPASPTAWLNLIHVDDAARVVIAAADADPLPDLLLVSDGSPLRRGDYFKELCRRLNAPAASFSNPGTDSPSAQRALGNKRVSNQAMIQALGLQLAYPDFRSGLAAILADDGKTTVEDDGNQS
ncbi:MAG: SDR family oxidoreductase [Pirellulaceae bacterium]|nr:SDR family oxidoreductase [Pirellulaceae bacterium]